MNNKKATLLNNSDKTPAKLAILSTVDSTASATIGAIEVLRRERIANTDDQPFVFANPNTGLPFINIFRSWDTARTRAQLPELRIHDLRHSFASFLVNAGRSLYEVQEILGHSDIRTTSRYAHLSQERLFDAVSMVPTPPQFEKLILPTLPDAVPAG